MMEVHARVTQLEYANAQVAALRGEMRALDNSLVMSSNELALTQQANTQLAEDTSTQAAHIGALDAALRSKDERLHSANEVLKATRQRVHTEFDQARLARLQLGSAQHQLTLQEQELTAARRDYQLAQVELEAQDARVQEAQREVEQTAEVAKAYENQLRPLRSSLRQKQETIDDFQHKQLGAALLSEKLHVAATQHRADAERVHAATRQVDAAELRANHASEHAEALQTILARREAGLKVIKKSLNAANEELHSSKEILAARHELQHELAKAREMVGSEQLATAATAARQRQLDVANELASMRMQQLGGGALKMPHAHMASRS